MNYIDRQKTHAIEGKSLVAFNAKNGFKILQKILNLRFTVKIVFYSYASTLDISSTILFNIRKKELRKFFQFVT